MESWPSLPYAAWRDTRDTLHMWTQIVGKVRMAFTPLVNHWWNVPLYVTSRGLSTSAIPHSSGPFDIEFDFVEHVLRIRVSSGEERRVRLAPRTVADFHEETMTALASVGIQPRIWTMPVEIASPIAFEKDHEHCAYDGEAVQRFWRALARIDAVLTKFRGEFIGKCSPVHFFWGSFDLAVTRFSGRRAPERRDADAITKEAYSHEVSSIGWWPGDERLTEASFYSYAAPEPEGFRAARIASPAYYHETLGGFYLPYDAVREAADPEETLLAFCRTTYDAAADLGRWDRAALERAEARA